MRRDTIKVQKKRALSLQGIRKYKTRSLQGKKLQMFDRQKTPRGTCCLQSSNIDFFYLIFLNASSSPSKVLDSSYTGSNFFKKKIKIILQLYNLSSYSSSLKIVPLLDVLGTGGKLSLPLLCLSFFFFFLN